MSRLWFDQSLPRFIEALKKFFEAHQLENGWILRDVKGRLTFVTSESGAKSPDEEALLAELRGLAPYVEPKRVVCSADQPGIDFILETSTPLVLDVGGQRIRLLDRRIVGSDWLTPPAPAWRPPTARFVFSSVKGGAGRSTALAVAAVYFALQGKNVLVLDLDLEAPGVGDMLLSQKERPLYGVLDYLVETGLAEVGDEFLESTVGASGFGAQRGILDVVPVCGLSTDGKPENFLAKLGRAYLEQLDEDGKVISLLERIKRMVNRLSIRRNYDLLLIDARAGLNETTAAAILGLGADVLLFAVNTPQNLLTYRYLLSTLALLPRDAGDDWLFRLKFVHAKASSRLEEQTAFRDKLFDLCADRLYRSDAESELSLTLDAPEAPHYAWPILFSQQYLEFDPFSDPSQLHQPVYEATFMSLLQGVRERMEPADV